MACLRLCRAPVKLPRPASAAARRPPAEPAWSDFSSSSTQPSIDRVSGKVGVKGQRARTCHRPAKVAICARDISGKGRRNRLKMHNTAL